jgi:hypothetical protein
VSEKPFEYKASVLTLEGLIYTATQLVPHILTTTIRRIALGVKTRRGFSDHSILFSWRE